jgi:hypothetical protein
MKVTNTASEARYLSALGAHVDAGETVEVDDQTAASLLEQGWTPVAAGPSKGELFDQAVELGIDAKKSWSAKRLQDAIDAATAAEDPEPADPGDSTTEADPAAPQED